MTKVDAAVERGVETTSPELVLVDPELARRHRERLPEPSDTLARLDLDLSRRRLTTLAESAIVTAEAATLDPTRSRMHWRPRTRSSRLLAGGAIAAGLVTVLLVGVNVDVRGTPAGADPTTPTQPPTQVSTKPVTTRPPPATSGRSRPRPTARSQAPSGRRFAWAPVPGASGYRVEFFREDTRIFSTTTTEPQLTLPPSWSFEGRHQRLVRGEYHWYVWPVVGGLRQSKATVQAVLAIP